MKASTSPSHWCSAAARSTGSSSRAYKAGEWGRDGDDDAVPLHYQAQCMWYLGITGQPWCDVAALIGGQRLVIRRIHRDDETIAAMLERADDFWHRHVPSSTTLILGLPQGPNTCHCRSPIRATPVPAPTSPTTITWPSVTTTPVAVRSWAEPQPTP